ncbi:MAG: (d)CMP kinase [Candidatus Izimaplasma sp.]|nr:(d)CMP kinase [Candidatus Izimaplasma bacterium]
MDKLEALLKSQQPMIIAIDGPSGSGKTTLANTLKTKYEVTLIHMDDYFLPNIKKTEERLNQPGGNVDLERIKKEVFEHINDDILVNHHFNCNSQTLEKRPLLKRRKLLIIEGVYSCHPELRPYYDKIIYCDVSRETQLKRIKYRNNKILYQRFVNEWIPLEDKYFNAFQIKEHADFVLNNE